MNELRFLTDKKIMTSVSHEYRCCCETIFFGFPHSILTYHLSYPFDKLALFTFSDCCLIFMLYATDLTFFIVICNHHSSIKQFFTKLSASEKITHIRPHTLILFKGHEHAEGFVVVL